MKKLYISLCSIILLSVFFLSCEKGELLNSEADILEIILPDSLQIGEPIITNTEIRIPKLAVLEEDIEKLDRQLKTLIPQFILTPGATLSDEGVAHDFNHLQTYYVTSEDRKWVKEYKIYFFNASFDNNKLGFNHYEIVHPNNPAHKSYYKFYEIDDSTGVKKDIWDSGNAGFYLTTTNGVTPEDYPTTVSLRGRNGTTAAMLVTRSTGALGVGFGMPLAAGNLFIGDFNVSIATQRPLEATQFGVPTTGNQPKELSLWCKYKAGSIYTEYDEVGKEIIERPDLTDYPEIYAVLYEPDKDEKGNPIKLNGHNVRNSDNIISIAAITPAQISQIRVNDIANDEYVNIILPFEPGARLFDPEKQKTGSYYITIVFSSSARGSEFEGAIGSTLCVDDVEFIRFE